ncbi:helix-turn-helix domain-containing protein [Candidatus Bipolaricaulota bacterium]|nr:helix-turn-helix domain-containing protein [Candidatus Bipolaricaulota bacterium]
MIYDGVELPKLLTVDEAAKVLGVDCEKISKMIKSRKLATMRVNGEIRIITESIEDRRKGGAKVILEKARGRL